MIINLSSIISLVALLFYGTLVWIVLSHEGRSRVIRTFSLYLVTMIIWSLGALLLYAGFEGTKPAFWDRFMLAGGMAMPIAFFVFVQAFLMHERRNWEIFGAFCYILFLVADFSGYLVTGTQVLNGRLFHEFGPAFIPSSIVWRKPGSLSMEARSST
jgi:hypothetical protein